MQGKQPNYPPTYNPAPPNYIAPNPAMHLQQTAFGPVPLRTECPSCKSVVFTRIRREPSSKTHILALLCCAFTCLGCVPYCVSSCQDANHYCPQCQSYIGKYRV